MFFYYSVQNKDSNCILYVRFKLPRLTLFRLALKLIGRIARVKRGLTVCYKGKKKSCMCTLKIEII